MRLTDEEIEVIREGLDLLLGKRPPKTGWDYVQRRTRLVAEDLYSRIRVEAACGR